MDAAINDGPLLSKYTASEIGQALVEQYYDILDRFPAQAWRFYAKKGKFKTIYPDGTTAVARDRNEQSKILLSPAPTGMETVLIDSVESTLCKSKDRVLVVATGPRFLQSFLLENCPGEQRSFAIVASVTHYLTTNPSWVDLPKKTKVFSKKKQCSIM